MRKFMPSDYFWQNGLGPLSEIYTITFVKGLSGHQTLERFSRHSLDIREFSHDEVMARWQETEGWSDIVGVKQLAGWTVAYEDSGWEGVRQEVQRELSRDGGEVIAVCRHDYAHDRFSYAVDGQVITGFDPTFPQERWGTDPDRVTLDMADLGLDPDHTFEDEFIKDDIAASLALASRISGFLVSEADFTWPMLGARITTRMPSDPVAPWRDRTG
ncbi:DUF6461 domain-containing protein [Streptosporangium sp. 'caverna']|uniref:DUF6461 domain-containing protein n=1 Tax=Streptosporangium sp. 'caverna' TaxID=2202249 RepID=UPI0013A69960|nr:DUF6461 domain-containing protein [Streptosporangium sp. 'caverna']